jgi:hypothetical protein
MADQHNVFISHRHEDDGYLAKLKELLAKNEAHDEAYIKSILAERMQWAGKIIVIITPDTKNHEWVDWEIAYAEKFPDKRIIGIWAPGAEESDLPDSLNRFADAVVPWDADKIIAAINGEDNWQGPDGTPPSPWVISRIGC